MCRFIGNPRRRVGVVILICRVTLAAQCRRIARGVGSGEILRKAQHGHGQWVLSIIHLEVPIVKASSLNVSCNITFF